MWRGCENFMNELNLLVTWQPFVISIMGRWFARPWCFSKGGQKLVSDRSLLKPTFYFPTMMFLEAATAAVGRAKYANVRPYLPFPTLLKPHHSYKQAAQTSSELPPPHLWAWLAASHRRYSPEAKQLLASCFSGLFLNGGWDCSAAR